ncbi:MAG: lysophospholipid acyltransferase family protein [Balneolaceae bacterium]
MQRIVLQFIYSFFLKWTLKLFIGVKFDNTDFLKEENAFIILANHNSHLDTITLLASLPPSIIHKVKPVAAGDYFGKTKLLALLSSYFINALLIDRKAEKKDPTQSPISKMIKEIDNGNSLILFPEGTRGEPEVMKPLKRGIGLVLAKRNHIPYIPVYLSGMGKTLPKGEKIIVPFNSYVKFGKFQRVKSEDSKKIISQIEHDIVELGMTRKNSA